MGKVYNPVIIMTDGPITNNPPYVVWNGTLSSLFEDWEKSGFSCLETTGNCRNTVRRTLKKNGTYRVYGGVGTFFDITVQES